MTLLLLFFVSLANALAPAESLAPSIDFQIYQSDNKLKSLFGKGNDSMLCWPSSLAHRMFYLQTRGNPPLTKLKLKSTPIDNVAKFMSMCRTSASGGTSQKRKVPCIRAAFKEAGYSVDAFSIGPDSKKINRAVEIKDLLENLKSGYAVILHVAWWKLVDNRWIEGGSHSLNAYGYEWNQDKMTLRVVNPGRDYSHHPQGQMYDTVEVKQLEHKGLTLSGPGFDRSNRLAVIKNIYVFKSL